MNLYPPNELLRQRLAKQVPPEMAIDHLIEYIIIQQAIIEALNDRLFESRTDIDHLIAHTGMKLNPKSKKKRPKKG